MPKQFGRRKRQRQWELAKLGLEHLQEGLAPFCHTIIERQHKDILDKIKKRKNLSTTPKCGQCNLRTLIPDHAEHRKNKKCPLNISNCICCRFHSRAEKCPYEICGAIYDEVAEKHTSTPGWNNTDFRQCASDAYCIARCFSSFRGKKFNISESLELILNNKYIHEYINIDTSRIDEMRNNEQNINRNSNMQLDKEEVDDYLDCMIAFLQNAEELKNETYAQTAVMKLQALKKIKIVDTLGDIIQKNQKRKKIFQKRKNVIRKIENIAKHLEEINGEKEYLNIAGTLLQCSSEDINQKRGPSCKNLEFNLEKKRRVDGRLIKLEEQQIEMLKKTCKTKIGEGSFGKVYRSETTVDGFGICIALKQITLDTDGSKDNSARREKLASKILHPFILPLLAFTEVDIQPLGSQQIWFVSPYCERGDLSTAIKDKVLTKQRTRVKILYHVALAIRYLHTEVPHVRKAILHKDIASRNVVLDAQYNARLIDFGLAREEDDETGTVTKSVFYRHPDIGKDKSAEESWDYYSFGVIIREVLTSLEPKGIEKKGRKLYLQNMKSEDVLKNISTDIWKNKEGAVILTEISIKCLEELELSSTEFNTGVVDNIRDIWWRKMNESELLDVPSEHAKCHICMINPKATETSLKQDHAIHCRQKIEVCISCEKNSFLNPITCYCDKDLEPNIGTRCGALLVAGNHEKPELAEAMTKDINELKKVITSRAPRIMGISEDMVRMVAPPTPGTSEARNKLWPEVKKHLEFFSKESEIDTLLIYFSCHVTKKDQNSMFELASPSDSIGLDDFKEELNRLRDNQRLIIVLDMCFPPLISLEKSLYIQINSCAQNQQANVTKEGSTFTKYFIQGLKAKSGEREKECSSDCQHCVTFWSHKSDFITADCLYHYVKNHIRDDNLKPPTPVGHKPLEWDNIAYFTHEKVEISFTYGEGNEKHIPLEYFQTMRQLEEHLCKVFKKNKTTTNVTILKDTFRKRDQWQHCDTLEKVMSAWINRQPLRVEFKTS